MAAIKTPNEWSKQALLDKSQRYAETMFKQDRDSWLFGFWSALTLEMLTKAAIANVSPTLIAEKEWKNIYFALGYPHPDGKPKSAAITDLLKRAEIILPGFNSDMLSFANAHMEKRNSEIHSGALPFDELNSSVWLAEFYLTCEFLLKTLNKTLKHLFEDTEVKTAKILIKAMNDKAAKMVQKTIAKHKKLWDKKSKIERDSLVKRATLWASRDLGHRVKCPSCGSDAIVKGRQSGVPVVTVTDQTIVIIKTPMLPSHFECSACRLRVFGYSKLNACKLGGVFTSTLQQDATEYYGAPNGDEWYGMEEDNNEP